MCRGSGGYPRRWHRLIYLVSTGTGNFISDDICREICSTCKRSISDSQMDPTCIAQINLKFWMIFMIDLISNVFWSGQLLNSTKYGNDVFRATKHVIRIIFYTIETSNKVHIFKVLSSFTSKYFITHIEKHFKNKKKSLTHKNVYREK